MKDFEAVLEELLVAATDIKGRQDATDCVFLSDIELESDSPRDSVRHTELCLLLMFQDVRVSSL